MSYCLRPIAARDEAMILEARNSERVRLYMLSQAMITPQEHGKWFAGKLADNRAPYFVFEHEGVAVGVAGMTHYDSEKHSAEWGFYIFSEAPKGAATAMLVALLEVLFARDVQQVVGLVFEENIKSMHLHKKLGFERKSVLAQYAHGRDVVVWQLTAKQWAQKRKDFSEERDSVRLGKA